MTSRVTVFALLLLTLTSVPGDVGALKFLNLDRFIPWPRTRTTTEVYYETSTLPQEDSSPSSSSNADELTSSVTPSLDTTSQSTDAVFAQERTMSPSVLDVEGTTLSSSETVTAQTTEEAGAPVSGDDSRKLIDAPTRVCPAGTRRDGRGNCRRVL